MRYALIALLLFQTIAGAKTYEVSPAPEARLELRVDKTGLYRGKTHVFLFEKYRGRLNFNSERPSESRIDLTIEAGSAVCTDTWISDGDKKKVMDEMFGEKVLAIQQFPTVHFVSTSMRLLAGNQFEALGMLTIRNISRAVTVDVTLDSVDSKTIRLTGSAKIHLKDYGIKPPSAVLGLIGTKEEMLLKFQIWGQTT